MDYLPIFLDLAGQKAVVVGGGDVAARKIGLLSAAGAKITVIAPEIAPTLAAVPLSHLRKRFEPGDLAEACLCIAATSDRAVNVAVAEAARARRIPVNVVDDPSLCSFIMPAIIDRGPIVVAVSSGGVSPVLARLIRTRLAAALPWSIARLAEVAAAWRHRVREALPNASERRRFWGEYFAGSWRSEAVTDPDVDHWRAHATPEPDPVIIRLAADAPDLLTLRDIAQIRSADAVLYDPQLPPIVLDQVRRDADLIAVSEPAALLERARHAAAKGKQVVALLAGR